MIPIGDSPRTRNAPLVNWALIAANLMVFLFELQLTGRQLNVFIGEWGATPNAINALLAQPMQPNTHTLATLVSSQFIHAGWLHVISNMLFLWIFGDNVEDTLGGVRYLVLYLLSGVAGAVAQALTSGSSPIPLVGASGAIAGVLGAYLLLFPTARVSTLLPIFLFFTVIQVPAVVVILLWFAVQLLSGLAVVGQAGGGGGIGYWAHIGGFAGGIVLLLIMGGRKNLRGRIEERAYPR